MQNSDQQVDKKKTKISMEEELFNHHEKLVEFLSGDIFKHYTIRLAIKDRFYRNDDQDKGNTVKVFQSFSRNPGKKGELQTDKLEQENIHVILNKKDSEKAREDYKKEDKEFDNKVDQLRHTKPDDLYKGMPDLPEPSIVVDATTFGPHFIIKAHGKVITRFTNLKGENVTSCDFFTDMMNTFRGNNGYGAKLVMITLIHSLQNKEDFLTIFEILDRFEKNKEEFIKNNEERQRRDPADNKPFAMFIKQLIKNNDPLIARLTGGANHPFVLAALADYAMEVNSAGAAGVSTPVAEKKKEKNKNEKNPPLQKVEPLKENTYFIDQMLKMQAFIEKRDELSNTDQIKEELKALISENYNDATLIRKEVLNQLQVDQLIAKQDLLKEIYNKVKPAVSEVKPAVPPIANKSRGDEYFISRKNTLNNLIKFVPDHSKELTIKRLEILRYNKKAQTDEYFAEKGLNVEQTAELRELVNTLEQKLQKHLTAISKENTIKPSSSDAEEYFNAKINDMVNGFNQAKNSNFKKEIVEEKLRILAHKEAIRTNEYLIERGLNEAQINEIKTISRQIKNELEMGLKANELKQKPLNTKKPDENRLKDDLKAIFKAQKEAKNDLNPKPKPPANKKPLPPINEAYSENGSNVVTKVELNALSEEEVKQTLVLPKDQTLGSDTKQEEHLKDTLSRPGAPRSPH